MTNLPGIKLNIESERISDRFSVKLLTFSVTLSHSHTQLVWCKHRIVLPIEGIEWISVPQRFGHMSVIYVHLETRKIQFCSRWTRFKKNITQSDNDDKPTVIRMDNGDSSVEMGEPTLLQKDTPTNDFSRSETQNTVNLRGHLEIAKHSVIDRPTRVKREPIRFNDYVRFWLWTIEPCFCYSFSKISVHLRELVFNFS